MLRWRRLAFSAVRHPLGEGLDMFGWFRPTCPCDPAAKRWVEERLQWLTRQFGLSILLERPVILPTDEFFPDPYDGTPKTVKLMFNRVCDYMGVDPDDVDI